MALPFRTKWTMANRLEGIVMRFQPQKRENDHVHVATTSTGQEFEYRKIWVFTRHPTHKK
jgi:hypothetical protein